MAVVELSRGEIREPSVPITVPVVLVGRHHGPAPCYITEMPGAHLLIVVNLDSARSPDG